MKKNILITILLVCVISLLIFYLLMPRTVFVKSNPIIIKDTIYKTDTVYINKSIDKKHEGSSKEVLAPPEPKKKEDTANPYKDVNLTYKIIPSENNTFGYEILMDGRLYIHQPNIPGLPGVSGFTDRKTAIKVAEMVILKIRKNEMPPSVSIAELEKISALK